jgi:hypothetical protein
MNPGGAVAVVTVDRLLLKIRWLSLRQHSFDPDQTFPKRQSLIRIKRPWQFLMLTLFVTIPAWLCPFKEEMEMEEGADETTDRETAAYLRRLEWAGIDIDRRRYRKNHLQPTSAVGGDVQASAAIMTISSPDTVPCSPNKAEAMRRIDLCTDGVRTKRSAAARKRTISASTVNTSRPAKHKYSRAIR